MDEVHRFNKAQQDALLPALEEGLVDFIGATTENPSFEVTAPLLSRSRVLRLEAALGRRPRRALLDRGSKTSASGLGRRRENFFSSLAGGDGRRMLNALEVAAGGTERVEAADVERAMGQQGARATGGRSITTS